MTLSLWYLKQNRCCFPVVSDALTTRARPVHFSVTAVANVTTLMINETIIITLSACGCAITVNEMLARYRLSWLCVCVLWTCSLLSNLLYFLFDVSVGSRLNHRDPQYFLLILCSHPSIQTETTENTRAHPELCWEDKRLCLLRNQENRQWSNSVATKAVKITWTVAALQCHWDSLPEASFCQLTSVLQVFRPSEKNRFSQRECQWISLNHPKLCRPLPSPVFLFHRDRRTGWLCWQKVVTVLCLHSAIGRLSCSHSLLSAPAPCLEKLLTCLQTGARNPQRTSWADMCPRKWDMAYPRRAGGSVWHMSSRRRESPFKLKMSHCLMSGNTSALESGQTLLLWLCSTCAEH